MAALRLVRLYLPNCNDGSIDDLLENRTVLSLLRDANYEDKLIVDLIVEAEQTEAILDEFNDRFGEQDGFQAVVSSVEAVARHPEEEVEEESADSEKDEEERLRGGLRVSREELYTALSESLGIDRVFLAMVVLSTIVAALGLVRDDLAVLIGAMVIAPLLGPNVALSLAVTLGDLHLLRKAAATGLTGIAIAFAVSVSLGAVLTVNPEVEAIADRTHVELSHFGLAMGAGAAGAIAHTRGMAGPVIGVMVAVALAPPLVACGLLLGAGLPKASFGAGLLVLVNLLSIHLAGAVSFLVQGVRPRDHAEAERAKTTSRTAIALLLLLLAALAAVMYYADQSQRGPRGQSRMTVPSGDYGRSIINNSAGSAPASIRRDSASLTATLSFLPSASPLTLSAPSITNR